MADRYNTPAFISEDPISVPHSFEKKEDIEISGLLTATIAWGNRKAILKSANFMMDMMDRSPYYFVCEASAAELKRLNRFVHRTFNGEDLVDYVCCLRHIYREYHGLEAVFRSGFQEGGNAAHAIQFFRKALLEGKHRDHMSKHVADPSAGSAAKRINMFLRWMVRNDNRGVDFGIWNNISPSMLSVPLDVHTGNVSRKLRLLRRKQNDAKAVSELDAELRKLDPLDPVRYDFALFGLGVSGDLD